MAGMTLVLIILVPIVAAILYGAWLAGELGLAPRWRRPERDGAHEIGLKRRSG